MPRFAGIIFALTVVLGIIASTHYYIWARLVRDLAWGEPWRTLGATIIGVLALSMPLTLFVARRMDASSAKPLLAIAFVWMGLFFITTCLLVSADAARWSFYIGRRLLGADLTFTPDRRLTLMRLVGGAVATLALGAGALALREALGGPEVLRVKVGLKRLPKGLTGFKIVQISDLHVAPLLGRAYVEDVVAKANALNADIVAITGDLVDGTVDQLRESVAPLGQLRAKHGVFFVTGNHEYYSGVTPWLQELQRLGIRPLRNERVAIGTGADSFDLAGVDDLTAEEYDPEGKPTLLPKTMAERDPKRAVVLLAHQPRMVFQAAALDVDLMLCGHTHGGQIWPFGFLVRLQQPYVHGLAQHGPTAIYVNRGTGYWGPPMRLGGAPELTLVTLNDAP